MTFWKKQRKVVLFIFGMIAFAVTAQANDRLQVVTSWSILEDVVKNIGGAQLDVQALAPRGVDLHSFKMTPGDQVKLRQAHWIVWLGTDLEIWLEPSLKQISPEKQLHLASHLEDLLPIGVPQDAHNHTSKHHRNDLHIWQSVPMMIQVSELIAQKLAQQDPQHAGDYQQNAAQYIEKLRQLQAWILQELSFIPAPQRILVTNHRAFEYFGRAYGFQTWAIRGYDHHVKPTPKTLQKFVQQLAQQGVKVLFSEAEGNQSLLNQVAKEAKIHTQEKLLADNLAPLGQPGSTYENFMKTNVQNMAHAFKTALGK